MKKLFDLENPVFQLLTRMADLILLSVVTLVCCLPVITAGPAFAAAARTAQELTQERCTGVFKTYIAAFRSNFRLALKAWLIAIPPLLALFCDGILLRLYFDGPLYQVLIWGVRILTALVIGVLCHLFALIAHYDNTVKEHYRNAAILTVTQFPKTLLMVGMRVLPVLLFSLAPVAFIQTLLFWILFGPGFMAQADAMMLLPVFEKLEEKA